MRGLRILASVPGEPQEVLEAPEQVNICQPESLRQLHEEILSQAILVLDLETEISRQKGQSHWKEAQQRLAITRPILCTLPPCEQDQATILENFLIHYNNSQSESGKRLQLDRSQFHFHEDGRIEEKKITTIPAYTIKTASGTEWSLCLVEYIDHNKETPSNYKTLKWMPLDENGSPVQYFDSRYEFTVTSDGIAIQSNRQKSSVKKAFDYLYRENGLVRTLLKGLLNDPCHHSYKIPWETFQRTLIEICTGNENHITGFINTPNHRRILWEVNVRPLDHQIIQEIDTLPKIPMIFIDPETDNRIEIMSPVLTDDKGTMFVLAKETSLDGTMAGVSAISIDKLRNLKPTN